MSVCRMIRGLTLQKIDQNAFTLRKAAMIHVPRIKNDLLNDDRQF